MEEEISFKQGDVVQLKSGSPPMTISEILDKGYIVCTWFVDGKTKITDTFHKSLLVLYHSGISYTTRPSRFD